MTPEEIEEIRERVVDALDDLVAAAIRDDGDAAEEARGIVLTALEEAEARVERYREALERTIEKMYDQKRRAHRALARAHKCDAQVRLRAWVNSANKVLPDARRALEGEERDG